MSSDEPSPPEWQTPNARQRKPQLRSCDMCRQRKIRCNTPSLPEGKCSNCISFGSPCTYLNPVRKRGPKSKLVEELRRKNAALEAQLQKTICSHCSQPLQSRPPSAFQHVSPASETTSTDPPSEEDDSQAELTDRFRQMNTAGVKDEFFGSASGYALVNNAMTKKEQLLGRPAVAPHSRRAVFFRLLPWEKEFYDQRPHYVYPQYDLIDALVELYFINVHPTFPVLHRPSFERCVAKEVYLSDPGFGAVLLAVLAIASRYSNDPRVLVEGEGSLSAGWKFVAQVQIVRKYFDPTINEAQFYCLLTLFTIGTSAPQVSWLYLGLGIRFLQHRGEHRRKREGHNFEDELWNRAFWSFFILDRMSGTFLGRPAAIHMDDYDVEPPLEVDDECLEQGFTQPLGKPSQLSFFVYFLRLCEILGDALRRLYATKKLKTRMGWMGTEWEQRTVAELDTAMNKFLDSIPPHLRWDANRQGIFFDQSALIYVIYYYAQITIHRPYIDKRNALAAPSLAICTNAARSALYIADIWITRLQRVAPAFLHNAVFVSAVILLLNIFGSKRAGLALDTRKDLEYVGVALDILNISETRCHRAGRMGDMIRELMSSDGSLPKPAPRDRYYSTYTAEPGDAVEDSALSWDAPLMSRGESGSPVTFAGSYMQPGPTLGPGVSIEELIATGSSADGILDDEMMSMWMGAPIDWNPHKWDTYIGNINVADITLEGQFHGVDTARA
ncbi:fungal-specific transcription factor domain-containing protein [Mycena maculata]|uniref:Fungal-specific transcription factor domain-containing protein n=1 Tax=Mycena maculata TaxID=230809 RepID=A0AAD7J748_9AGAR|nr:fungal-specific transcription factor domain-containing protein [Mycena maculata]